MEPEDGYYLAFSGGKDSQVIYHLAVDAGVKFDAHYNLTTVDPPELIYFIRENYPDVIFNKPKETMWQLISRIGMPPTRLARYCCSTLKENGGSGRTCITGVRWAESVARKNNRGEIEINNGKKTEKMLFSDNEEDRRQFEICIKKGKRIVNPIVGWTTSEVWDYHELHQLKHCYLYDEGFERLGCIGCPMASPHQKEIGFARWPKYYQGYLRAFDKMLNNRKLKGLETCLAWENAEGVMKWWIYGGDVKQLEGQIGLEEDEEG